MELNEWGQPRVEFFSDGYEQIHSDGIHSHNINMTFNGSQDNAISVARLSSRGLPISRPV